LLRATYTKEMKMSIEVLYPSFLIIIIGRDGSSRGMLHQIKDYFVAYDSDGSEYGRAKRLSSCEYVYESYVDPGDMAEAKAAIKMAKEKMPDLTAWGTDRWGTNFARNREEFEPIQVATAIAFLNPIYKTQQPTMSSYGLKHFCETWGEASGLCPYVSNGALIAAAVWLGIKIKRLGGPNVGVAVRKRDVWMMDDWAREKIRESESHRVFRVQH
jgi:hypothetical protein